MTDGALDVTVDTPCPAGARLPGMYRTWFSAEGCNVADLIALVEMTTDLADYPHAAAIEHNVVVYDSDALRLAIGDPDRYRSVQAELAAAILDGPGVVVFRAAFADTAVVDAATAVFEQMIADQHALGSQVGDHFAAPGSNDRVWNALEKLALLDPHAFAEYYANEIVALAATAWLGPGYQITSQVNVVNPGGQAQSPHRDYHLGFLADDIAEQFPPHVHRLSPALTLQGAVAHCDMPLESGPTLYLPHSHKYDRGYLAWRRPEFVDYFAAHHVQLPLRCGDAVFFNPAVFHAAGTNRTAAVRRMANLLQVSSPFGRAMETVDRDAMVLAVYPALVTMGADGATQAQIHNAIAACAEGYPFPTNLDRDPPIDGLAPESQAALVARAVAEQWEPVHVQLELKAAAIRRASH